MLADFLTVAEQEDLEAGIRTDKAERGLSAPGFRFPSIPDGCPARQRKIILERRAEAAGINLEARAAGVAGRVVTDQDIENLKRASRIARTL